MIIPQNGRIIDYRVHKGILKYDLNAIIVVSVFKALKPSNKFTYWNGELWVKQISYIPLVEIVASQLKAKN